MAVPKVFISSTYYDLRQERSNIAEFIKSLGYEPVLHERSGVTYTQSETLENDCYNEISNCDMLICIIGNHFGSFSAGNDYSITMNELKSAMKDRKKIFIFILKDVYVENATYLKNKDSGVFTPAYADDIKIHEFIADLKQTVKRNPIESFENTNEIIENLKGQFAGMFQRLLVKESTLTNLKTIKDLQEIADEMKLNLADFVKKQEETAKNQEETVNKINSAVFANKLVFRKIREYLGINRAFLIIDDLETLDHFMELVGFQKVDEDIDYRRIYKKIVEKTIKTLKLTDELFNDNWTFKDIRNQDELNKYLIYEEEPNNFINDDDIPF